MKTKRINFFTSLSINDLVDVQLFLIADWQFFCFIYCQFQIYLIEFSLTGFLESSTNYKNFI